LKYEGVESDWTDWDRFVIPEYRRIENMQENDEGGEVLNW